MQATLSVLEKLTADHGHPETLYLHPADFHLMSMKINARLRGYDELGEYFISGRTHVRPSGGKMVEAKGPLFEN